METRMNLTPTQRELLEAATARRQRFDAAAQRAKQQPAPSKSEPVIALAPSNLTPIPEGAIQVPWSDEIIPFSVTVHKIQKAVIKEYRTLTMVDMRSSRRDKNTVRPRQIAMYLAKKMTGKSLPGIGRDFGGRDHTTVCHAIKTIGNMMNQDPEFAARVEAIKARIEREASGN